MERINELKKDLNETDNYIEKYFPVKILNYVHDCLI